MHVGILGGGLSGVSLQSWLTCPSTVLEKENRIGGLCRTFGKDGFLYDIGGHILFSKNDMIMKVVEELLGDNILFQRRNNKVLFKGKYVKYPFENGLGELAREDIYDCLIGYLKNENPKPVNFKDWLLYTFGNGIAGKYLIPYNTKIWKLSPEELALEPWIERLPRPPLEDIVKSALGFETEGYTHQLNFRYPKHGGIESLVKAAVKTTPDAVIKTNFEVRAIRKKGAGWEVSDGRRTECFDRIVSTLPIMEVVHMLEEAPADVRRAADALRYNMVRIILIGVNNPSLLDKTAVYVPDPAITPHRICYMGYFSPYTVPPGKSSIMTEITTPPQGHELSGVSDAVLIERVVQELDQAGVINQRDVIVTDITNMRYGYVVHDVRRMEHLPRIHAWFREVGIDLLGRFGEFDYINTDEVLRRSRALADRINSAKPS